MDLMETASHWYNRGSAMRRWLHGGGTRVDGLRVISVGALRAGGVGKSVVARALADQLSREGCATAVVLRGYGGSEQRAHEVVDGDTVDRVGDEALEHATLRRGDWRVIVARDRIEGARLARALGAQTVVLDDGFQHRQLARDVDIVLVAKCDGTAQTWPAGPLREPISALTHADLVASTDEDAPGKLGDKPVHSCRVDLRGYVGPTVGMDPRVRWRGARALLVTGIARPERVCALLLNDGVQVVEHRQFRDHQRLPPDALTPGWGVDVVLVTAKDAVRGMIPPTSGVPWRMVVVDAELHPALRECIGLRRARAAPRDAVEGR